MNEEQNIKWIPYKEVLDFLKWQFDNDFADQQINLFHIKEGKIVEMKKKEVNLSNVLRKNKNCLGYILPFNNGKYTYQNDNDLGLDLEGLDQIAHATKVFIYKRYYAYLICDEDIEDDGSGIDFEMAKLLLKECHKHFIPLTKEEEQKCQEYWEGF